MTVRPLAPTVLRWFLQLLVGGLLFGSAVGKALDLPGFVEVLRTYQAFPDVTLLPLAVLLTSVELVLGTWLLSGWRLQTGALVAAVLNAGYGAWMMISLVRGLELANCGCFGVFFAQPLRWYSPVEDVVLVALCYTLRRLSGHVPGRTPVLRQVALDRGENFS